jgi:hypothetical protein
MARVSRTISRPAKPNSFTAVFTTGSPWWRAPSSSFWLGWRCPELERLGFNVCYDAAFGAPDPLISESTKIPTRPRSAACRILVV